MEKFCWVSCRMTARASSRSLVRLVQEFSASVSAASSVAHCKARVPFAFCNCSISGLSVVSGLGVGRVFQAAMTVCLRSLLRLIWQFSHSARNSLVSNRTTSVKVGFPSQHGHRLRSPTNLLW